MRILALPIATLCVLLTALLAARYEPGVLLAAGCCVLYAVVLSVRPHAWLIAIPALVPILDLRPFTGWSFFGELDLVVLVTIVMGYGRIAVMPGSSESLPGHAHRRAWTAVGLLLTSCFISLAIGLLPIKTIDVNSFTNYYSNFNAVRLLKGPLFASALLPLWFRAAAADAGYSRRLLAHGMLAGLTGACLSVLWERAAFPGLMDFASDYRVTGLFSGSHVGGASLDGYLMLALPFCVFCVLGHMRVWLRLAAVALFAACLYAVLVTFTRTTYVAAAIMLPMAILLALPRRNAAEPALAAAWKIVTLVGVLAWMLTYVFSTSGYRGLAAALGVVSAAYFLAGRGPRLRLNTVGWISSALLCALPLAALAIPQAVYGTYALLACAFAYMAWKDGPAVDYAKAMTCVLAGLTCNSLAIAWFWAGPSALPAMALATGTIFASAWLNCRQTAKLWRASREIFPTFIAVVLAAGIVIPVLCNYYIAARFADVERDMETRSRHWHNVFSMIDDTASTWLFGMGLGRFPETYYWRNSEGEFPGSYRFVRHEDTAFLRLAGPKYPIGYGDSLRFAQSLQAHPETYRLKLTARAGTPNATLDVAVCEKHLIYPGQCVTRSIAVPNGDFGWKEYEVTLEAGELAHAGFTIPRPRFLTFGTQTQGAQIDVRGVALRDRLGVDMLDNGSFSHGMRSWFFTSDRYHLPYHAKNLFLHVLFEQGIVGIAWLTVALLWAFGRATTSLRRDALAPVLGCSLAGFVVTGMFDSLIDDPQVALLFYFLLLICLTLPRQAETGASFAGAQSPHTARPERGESGAASAHLHPARHRFARTLITAIVIPFGLIGLLAWAFYFGLERTPGELLRFSEVAVADSPRAAAALAPIARNVRERFERPVPPGPLPTFGKGAGYQYSASESTAAAQPKASKVLVRSVDELKREVERAVPGGTIELLPGKYNIRETIQTSAGGTVGSPIVVRAAALGSVIIESATVETFKVMHPYWIFENLTVVGVCPQDNDCEHAFHIAGPAVEVILRNNRLSEFNAAVKINGEDGRWPDNGMISRNTLDNSHPRATSRPVAMVDLVGANGWSLVDNHVSGFVKSGGDRISYGVFMKGAGKSGRIERNLLVCTPKDISQAGVRVGISFGGGGSDPAFCRDRACLSEYVEGVVANNIVAHCNDFGIDVNASRDIVIAHNTLINTAGIDVRGASTAVSIYANVLEGQIRARSGSKADAGANVIAAMGGYFTNPDLLDLTRNSGTRNVATSPLVERDFCSDPRAKTSPAGALGLRSNCAAMKQQ